MSLDFQYAKMCKGDTCTNRLTSRTEHERDFCDLCWPDVVRKVKREESEVCEAITENILSRVGKATMFSRNDDLE